MESADETLPGIADWAEQMQSDLSDLVRHSGSLEAAIMALPSWFESRSKASQAAFAAWLAAPLLAALLSGVADAQEHSAFSIQNSAFSNAAPTAGYNVKFLEAIEQFRRKGVIDPDAFARLEAAAKARTFSVAGLTDRYALDQIKGSLQAALESGRTMNNWLTLLEDNFKNLGLSGVGDNAWHMRLVFRQNAFTAYGAGRWVQMRKVAQQRPWWQYVTAGDDRVRPEHAALDGVIKRADDPFWKRYYPPNGFGCRCMVVSVSNEELAAEGLSETSDDQVAARYAQLVPSAGGLPPIPEGFAYDPAAAFGNLEGV